MFICMCMCVLVCACTLLIYENWSMNDQLILLQMSKCGMWFLWIEFAQIINSISIVISHYAQQQRICLQCRRHGFNWGLRKTPWRRKQQLTLVFLLEKSHGQRNLLGYSPCSHKESDTTEQLSTHSTNIMTLFTVKIFKKKLNLDYTFSQCFKKNPTFTLNFV